MAIRVAPSNARNTHHIKLSDGVDEVGLILCDGYGNADHKAIQRSPYPRSALKFSQGEQKYSDLEPPFSAMALEDFTGGRGLNDYEVDRSRYSDAYRLNTLRANRVILGAQETLSSGYQDGMNIMQPGNMEWTTLAGTTRWVSRKFTMASGGNDIDQLVFWVRFFGKAADITVGVYSDSGGSPNAAIWEDDLVNGVDLFGLVVDSYATRARVTPVLSGLSAGTDYHFVISAPVQATPDEDYVQVGVEVNGSGGKQSSTGSSWSANLNPPYCIALQKNTPFKPLFFEYKRGLYMVTSPNDGSASKVYINGERGAADSNSADKTYLNDATKSWTTNEFAGGIVYIINGPGSEEHQPWRRITANSGTALTVADDWLIAHTTETEYVIIGVDKWRLQATLSSRVIDAAVADDLVYFACGEDAAIVRYQEYNNAGTWSVRSAAESMRASHLKAIHGADGVTLWGSRNNHSQHGKAVWGMRAPRRWGSLYHSLGTLWDGKEPLDEFVIANVTNSVEGQQAKVAIASGFTTGIIAGKRLGAAIDVTKATRLGMLLYADTARNANEFQLALVSEDNDNRRLKPAGAWHYEPTTYTDVIQADNSSVYTLTLTTAGYIYIGGSRRFSGVRIGLGATKNAAASVLSAEVFKQPQSAGNTAGWSSVTISDGSTSGGATLAQDGDVTFTPPDDWAACIVNDLEAYWVRLKVSANLTGSVNLASLTIFGEQITWLNIPALIAGTNWVEIDISPNKYALPDETIVNTILLKQAVDVGATELKFYSGIELLATSPEYINLPNEARINGIEAYSGSQDTPRQNPWIFTENAVYEVQVQNNNSLVSLPLAELAALRDAANGQAHTTNGVYLYFNLGGRIERYYNRQLDDVGPDRDQGLPSARRGNVEAMASYPGRVFAAVNGADASSILVLSGSGWHEVLRFEGNVQSLQVQQIPGRSERLWVGINNPIADIPTQIYWLPVAANPENYEDYRYTHQGWIEIGKIYFGLLDVEKYFKSLKLVTENLSAEQQITVDYKVDGNASWTEAESYSTSPVQEQALGSKLTGKWIELRLRFETTEADTTPILRAAVLEALTRIPVKFAYNMTFRLADKDPDLQGDWDGANAEDMLTQLDTWLTSAEPLTMTSFSFLENNKTVFIDPASVRRIGKVVDEGREIEICQMTVIEV